MASWAKEMTKHISIDGFIECYDTPSTVAKEQRKILDSAILKACNEKGLKPYCDDEVYLKAIYKLLSKLNRAVLAEVIKWNFKDTHPEGDEE